jgi:hypothetical protein
MGLLAISSAIMPTRSLGATLPGLIFLEVFV